MRRLGIAIFPLLASCSLLVELDDDDAYTSGDDDSIVDEGNTPLTGGSDGSGGERPYGGGESAGGETLGGTGGETSSGGASSGGAMSGGAASGGAASGGAASGGAASGGAASGGAGTGGEIQIVELPDALHHYPLDQSGAATVTDFGTASIVAAVTDPTAWLPAAGITGGAYEVKSGGNHYLELHNSIASQAPFTISWWCSPTVGDIHTLMTKTANQVGVGGFMVYSSNGAPVVRIGDAQSMEWSGLTLLPSHTEGVWTHLVFSFEPNAQVTKDRVRLWVNGEPAIDEMVLLPSGVTVENNAQLIRFGAMQGDPVFNQYTGLLDEVRIYDLLLTDEEVRSLYWLDAQ